MSPFWPLYFYYSVLNIRYNLKAILIMLHLFIKKISHHFSASKYIENCNSLLLIINTRMSAQFSPVYWCLYNLYISQALG